MSNNTENPSLTPAYYYRWYTPKMAAVDGIFCLFVQWVYWSDSVAENSSKLDL